MDHSEALLIGGRAGVGKTTVGWEVSARLNGRGIGSELERELANSVHRARVLDERAPVDTVRVVTDGRSVVDVAGEVPAATGWVDCLPLGRVREVPPAPRRTPRHSRRTGRRGVRSRTHRTPLTGARRAPPISCDLPRRTGPRHLRVRGPGPSP